MSFRHRIILTGGGTGGHIYPALAIAEQLKRDASVEDILYIGAAGHLEEKLAKEKDLAFVGLDISGMPRKISSSLLTWPIQTLGAIFEARRVIKKFKPTVILGTGGYASAPPLFAAMFSGIPYVIHEPDAHPGVVNRLFARNAKVASCGMHGAYDYFKKCQGRVIVNGNPVSERFINLLNRDAACAVLGLNPDLKTVLITGGSQGAQAINDAVLYALPTLLAIDPQIQIIHQVGKKNIHVYKEHLDAHTVKSQRYFLREYFDDLSIPYAIADLAVSRSGAMTIAELAVTHTPALFIPYPFAAANHQYENALLATQKGAARLLTQDKLNSQSLHDEILTLLSDTAQLKLMGEAMATLGSPKAASDLANQLKEVSTEFQIKKSKERIHA
jgi:UDP-N-acetylglucosamine--N-acetylmuramyl-(pentapeptide) pyrophosphoryl-undecaprenol N-acetylglucosamine transferase